MLVDFDVREQQEMHFFTGGSIFMDVMDVILNRSGVLKLKYLNGGFVYNKHTAVTSPDVNWGIGVVWIIVMFLSAVWSLILTAPIHCSASIAESWISSNIFYISSTPRLHLDWPKGEYIFT